MSDGCSVGRCVIGKKSKSSTGPSKQALQYLTPAQNMLTGAVNANAPNVANIAGTLRNEFQEYANAPDRLAPARGYASDVLGGKYLDQGNPHLGGMIDDTADDVTDRVNSIFGAAGRTGGGRHVGRMTEELAEAENGLRYADYNAERGRMGEAANLSLGLGQADNQRIAAMLALGEGAAELPYLGARTLASGTGGLWGNSTTTTQKQGLGASLGGLVGSGLAGWATGGFH